MSRPGITREQVFAAADTLAQEGQNPTVVAVRTALGGGSPNTITPLLAEWKATHETGRAAETMPAPPKPVEMAMNQVWGAAWQEAQSQLEGEREALSIARKEMEKERAEMLAEIGRMDSGMDEIREALRIERSTHEQTKGKTGKAQALAEERKTRIEAQDRDLREIRQELSEASAQVATLTERAAQADTLRAALIDLETIERIKPTPVTRRKTTAKKTET